MFSKDFLEKGWSVLVGLLSFYLASKLVFPETFGLFLLFATIGATIYNRLIYWTARLVLFVNDYREANAK